MLRWCLAVLIMLGGATIGAWPTGTVDAHAVLLDVNPPDNSRLDEPFDTVTLRFNENVEAIPDRIRHLDHNGNDLEIVDIDGTGRDITITITETDGPQLVTWAVVSADSHIVGGTLAYGVNSDPPGQGDIDVDLNLDGSWLEHLGRSLSYLTLIAAGMAAVWGRKLWKPRAGLALAGIAGAALQWWAAGGLHNPATTSAAVAGIVALTPGRYGAAGIVAFAWGRIISGHVATMSPAIVAATSQAVHLAAVATWCGAVVGLAVLRTDTAARHCSRTATWSVAALIPAGLTLWWTAGGGRSLDSRWDTTLAIKLAVVVGGLTLGTINHLALRREGWKPRVVVAEVVVMVVIGVVTALAVTSPPPQTSGPQQQVTVFETVDVGDINVNISGAVDGDHIHLYAVARDDTGRIVELDDINEPVTALAAAPDNGIDDLHISVTPAGAGTWEIHGYLPFDGTWELDVTVRTTMFDRERVTIPLNS